MGVYGNSIYNYYNRNIDESVLNLEEELSKISMIENFNSIIYDEYINYKNMLESCIDHYQKPLLEAKVEVLYEITIKDITGKIKELWKRFREFCKKIWNKIKQTINIGMIKNRTKQAKSIVKNMGKKKDGNELKVSKEFFEAVQSGKVLRVRIMMKDSLLVDKTFKDFNAMEKAAASMKGLYDEHDAEELIKDKNSWNIDYMNSQMVQVVNNFSRQRLNHLKEVIRHVYNITPKQEQTNLGTMISESNNDENINLGKYIYYMTYRIKAAENQSFEITGSFMDKEDSHVVGSDSATRNLTKFTNIDDFAMRKYNDIMKKITGNEKIDNDYYLIKELKELIRVIKERKITSEYSAYPSEDSRYTKRNFWSYEIKDDPDAIEAVERLTDMMEVSEKEIEVCMNILKDREKIADEFERKINVYNNKYNQSETNDLSVYLTVNKIMFDIFTESTADFYKFLNIFESGHKKYFNQIQYLAKKYS